MRFLLLILSLLVAGCEFIGSDEDERVDVNVPSGFEPIPIPDHNPLTPSKVALGERLFFDPLLSRDQTISCASCHLPELAFTDGVAKSEGIEGRIGLRNSPTLVNVAYLPLLFWDGGALTLENQVFAPLQDHNEMDAELDRVLGRLHTAPSYVEDFERAFGEEATLRSLTQALAAFQRTIRSGGSRYDRFLDGDRQALSASQRRGLDLFENKANCATCHAGFLFSNLAFVNNGLIVNEADSGRARITLKAEDYGKYRVPSLRNVALTAPYMHDGRFSTLMDVVVHYNHGGVATRNRHEAIMPLKLSDQEQTDLVAFLNALTDMSIRYGLDN